MKLQIWRDKATDDAYVVEVNDGSAVRCAGPLSDDDVRAVIDGTYDDDMERVVFDDDPCYQPGDYNITWTNED